MDIIVDNVTFVAHEDVSVVSISKHLVIDNYSYIIEVDIVNKVDKKNIVKENVVEDV